MIPILMVVVLLVWMLWFVFGWCFRVVQTVVHAVLLVLQGSKRGVLSPVEDVLLLEPAVVVADKIRNGKVKSQDVVQSYIDRIRAVNVHLNAVVEDRFSEAIQDAKAADHYVATSGRTPEQLANEKPLLGVPFTSKDAIAVKGLALTAGVVCRKDLKASFDCRVVSYLRSSGAIPLCVTNVPELCTWWDASNNLYGATYNPHDLTRSPGGSSGGEGALLASAAALFGLGNDIGGSIRNPSFCCGIFGHKPTRRLISNEGQFPTTHNTVLDYFNCTGPMCRYAVDLAPLLKVMAGPNANKLNYQNHVDLRTLKVYYTEDYINHPLVSSIQKPMREAVQKAVKHLESSYGMKATKVTIPHLDSIFSIWLTETQTPKVPLTRPQMVTPKGGEFNLPQEFVKFILRRSDHTFNFLHLELLSAIQRWSRLEKTNKNNHVSAKELEDFFKNLLGEDGIFIFPSGTSTAPFHLEQNLRLFNQAYLFLFNVLGLPVTQCPMGLSSDKLPLGVQVASNYYNDNVTIAVGRAIEEQFGGWIPPS